MDAKFAMTRNRKGRVVLNVLDGFLEIHVSNIHLTVAVPRIFSAINIEPLKRAAVPVDITRII
jgi:hypothetical protein